MKNTTNPMAAFLGVQEQYGIAPIAPVQGTGLSFAGAYGAPVMTIPVSAQHGTTLLAVRKDDAGVPEPRGRQR